MKPNKKHLFEMDYHNTKNMFETIENIQYPGFGINQRWADEISKIKEN
jgi:hypothetical protein